MIELKINNWDSFFKIPKNLNIDRSIDFTQLHYIIWLTRRDLQILFPLNNTENIQGYLDWCKNLSIFNDKISISNINNHLSFSIPNNKIENIIKIMVKEKIIETKLEDSFSIVEKFDALLWLLNKNNKRFNLSRWIIIQMSFQIGFNIYLIKFIYELIKYSINAFTLKEIIKNSWIGIKLISSNYYKFLYFPFFKSKSELKKINIPKKVANCIINRKPNYNPSYRTGVNIVGTPSDGSGIGGMGKAVIEAFSKTNISYSQLDLNDMNYKSNKRSNIFCMTAHDTLNSFCNLGMEFFKGRINIGYWHWELPRWPKALVPLYSLIDELWVSSKYEYNAFKNESPIPIKHMPYPVFLPPINNFYNRKHFNLNNNKFIFLTSFSFSSYLSRKNIIGSVKAFKKAFSNKNRNVELVIKTSEAEKHINDKHWIEVFDAISKDNRIRLINKYYTIDEIWSLNNVIDCYLSLHCAEGFGQNPSNCMLMGKPVIVTNFSGNLDYNNSNNSCLVDYDLVPIGDDDYEYGHNQKWAKADIEHASWFMRKLYNDNLFYNNISKAGQKTILEQYNPLFLGKRYEKRLRELKIL